MKRAAFVAVAALLGLLGFAAPALAHNALISSNPKDGASVAAGPSAVTLTFDQPVQEGEQFNSIVVIGPNGDHWEGGTTTVDGTSVSMPLRPLGPAGTYTVSFQVLSNDGHPVREEVRFTLTKAGTGTPTPGTTAVKPGDTGSGVPLWVWIGGAVVLLGAGVTLALRAGGQRA